jgi:hypothetical protein
MRSAQYNQLANERECQAAEADSPEVREMLLKIAASFAPCVGRPRCPPKPPGRPVSLLAPGMMACRSKERRTMIPTVRKLLPAFGLWFCATLM